MEHFVCVFYFEFKRKCKKNDCSKITPDLHLAKIYLRTCKASYFLDLVLEATYILYLVPSYSPLSFTMVYTVSATVEQMLNRGMAC